MTHTNKVAVYRVAHTFWDTFKVECFPKFFGSSTKGKVLDKNKDFFNTLPIH